MENCAHCQEHVSTEVYCIFYSRANSITASFAASQAMLSSSKPD